MNVPYPHRNLLRGLQSSPRAAIALIRSAVRQAIAWMVSDGLTPPTVGNTEPSQIHRFGMSQERQSALTTLVAGSSPMRAVPFRWQVSSVSSQISSRAGGFERLAHEAERMRDQPLVVVAVRIGDARHRQAVLILLVGERHAIALLRQAFADDLEPDLMIVLLHLLEQRFAPQAALARLRSGPYDRQRPLAHVGVAAEEILAAVGVVPVLGDRERRRTFIGSGSPAPSVPQTAWFDCTIRFLPTSPERIGEAIGKRGAWPN